MASMSDLETDGPSVSQTTDAFPRCLVFLVQTQSNLLEKISSYNLDRFSQLVSMIIVKSWPVRTGQSKDDFDEILHHVLTWPDIKRVFSFSGMC